MTHEIEIDSNNFELFLKMRNEAIYCAPPTKASVKTGEKIRYWEKKKGQRTGRFIMSKVMSAALVNGMTHLAIRVRGTGGTGKL